MDNLRSQTHKNYHVNHVPPEVYVLLLRMIKSSCRNTDLTWTEPLSPAITNAINSQTTLGHDLTFCWGYLSREWMTAIRQFHPDKLDLHRLPHSAWTVDTAISIYLGTTQHHQAR